MAITIWMGPLAGAEPPCGRVVINANGAPRNHREGALWRQPSQTDLLFITVNRGEAPFFPSARPRDLALGPPLFHWESQNNTCPASANGQRTIHPAARGWRIARSRTSTSGVCAAARMETGRMT